VGERAKVGAGYGLGENPISEKEDSEVRDPPLEAEKRYSKKKPRPISLGEGGPIRRANMVGGVPEQGKIDYSELRSASITGLGERDCPGR